MTWVIENVDLIKSVGVWLVPFMIWWVIFWTKEKFLKMVKQHQLNKKWHSRE